MIKKTAAFFVSFLALCTYQVSAETYGVDFPKVNWSEVCPNVKPLSVRGCNTVHPTSLLFNNTPSTRIKDKYLNCKREQRRYQEKLKPRNVSRQSSKWSHCRIAFKSAYIHRVMRPQYFSENVESWRNRYLKSGVVNENGHVGRELK